MASVEANYNRGLEGVVADESKICFIDGQKGILAYQGYSIKDLAQCTFPEVTFLLLYGKLPNKNELKEISQKLVVKRSLPRFVVDIIKSFPKSAHPMEVLQTCVAALGTVKDEKNNEEKVLTLIAQFPLIVTSYYRHLKGQKILSGREEGGHAANFLYLLSGKEPAPEEAQILETSLILHMEHGFNASTFAARAIGSTLAPYHACVAGAIGSLYGPLHGGANEGVLKQVEEAGQVENVEKWVAGIFSQKKKIVGMGHRVYKVKDPRAYILEDMLKELSEKKGDMKNYEMLKAVEVATLKEMQKLGKRIYPNVDFFSGALYRLLGIDDLLFTPLFAIARVVGWSAHLLEQWKDNRLYRPELFYKGLSDLTFVPLEQR